MQRKPVPLSIFWIIIHLLPLIIPVSCSISTSIENFAIQLLMSEILLSNPWLQFHDPIFKETPSPAPASTVTGERGTISDWWQKIHQDLLPPPLIQSLIHFPNLTDLSMVSFGCLVPNCRPPLLHRLGSFLLVS